MASKKQTINFEEPITIEGIARNKLKKFKGEKAQPSQTPRPRSAPTPIFEGVDPQIEREQPKEQEDSGMDPANLRSLLLGATPLLAGLLAGDVGAGVRVAGDALLEDEAKKEKSLAEWIKDRRSARNSDKRRYQFIPVEREDGTIVNAVGDTATGDLRQTDTLRGYARGTFIEPTTKERVGFSKSRGYIEPLKRKDGSIVGGEGRPFNLKDEEDVKWVQEKTIGDKQFEKARARIGETDRAIAMLATNTPISSEGLMTIYPRMFGEVGNLAYAEQERFAGSRELGKRALQLKEKFLETGKLTEENRDDLYKIALVFRQMEGEKANSIVNQYAQMLSRRTGISMERARSVIEPLLYTKERLSTSMPERVAGEARQAAQERMIPMISPDGRRALVPYKHFKKAERAGFKRAED